MSTWGHGYNVEGGYTYSFFKEITPEWLNFVATVRGLKPPHGERLRYLEMGCGQGVGLTLMALCHPDMEFVGVDYNPLHIAHAKDLARDLGVGNVRFIEADFIALGSLWPPELGTFDYAVMHGILSWVPQPVRLALVQSIGHATRPGALVYASYNAQPGWVPAIPLQHYLRHYQKAKGLSSRQGLQEGALKLLRLADKKALVFSVLGTLESRIKGMQGQDASYLVQEYIHDNWYALWFSQVASEFDAVKLRYAASATLPDNWLASMVSPALQEELADIADEKLLQETLDLMLNQSFRRDVFQRGLYAAWSADVRDTTLALKLRRMNVVPREPYTFATTAGEINGDGTIYPAIMAAVQDGPKTLQQVVASAPALQSLTVPRLLQTVALLIHGGDLYFDQAKLGVKAAEKANRILAAKVASGAPYSFLVAAYAGTAILAELTDILLLNCWPQSKGANLEPTVLADGLLRNLALLGRQLAQDGKPLTEPEEARAYALTLAQTFVTLTLPRWKMLGVVQG